MAPPLIILLLISFFLPSTPTPLHILLTDLGLDSIPNAPCNLPGLSCDSAGNILRISLPSSRLAGTISPSISNLSSLLELSLPDNSLTGPIPPELSLCQNLQILDLRRNKLSGPVPASLSTLSTSLRVLDIADNRLSGDLSFLSSFTNLRRLSIANNLFSGRAPATLASFPRLRSLDVSGNPSLLSSSQRRRAGHRQSSVLSKRYVLAETNTTTNRNSTVKSNSTRTHSNTTTATTNSTALSNSTILRIERLRKRHKIRNWVLGFIAGSIAGLFSGLFLSVLFRFAVNCFTGRFRNPGGPSIFSPHLIRSSEDLAFLDNEEELLSLEIIGRGGCGEVYKKELPPNPKHPDRPGTVIAIKRIMKRNMDTAEPTSDEESRLLDKWMKQIRSEIQTVGHIRHRNLLPLVAHVTRPTCHYLVYEYMKNGSLEAVLKAAADGTMQLDWLLRYKIAVGISAGLTYLHHHHKPQIIHRDLKPANILLDDDMEPRIADFGLAKEMPDAHTHITSSNVVGTLGYIAPEYHQMMKYTAKCDIFSFGVILATLVIGKLPSDEFFQTTEEYSLVKWLRNVMKSDKPRSAIDEKLLGNGFEEQMLLVLKIACFCTVEEPRERPDSKDVRVMLVQIKH